MAAKRDQEQASSELAQEASRGGDKPGRTDKAGQVQGIGEMAAAAVSKVAMLLRRRRRRLLS